MDMSFYILLAPLLLTFAGAVCTLLRGPELAFSFLALGNFMLWAIIGIK
jgi:hypothetical protein